jgi:hypothetical protein
MAEGLGVVEEGHAGKEADRVTKALKGGGIDKAQEMMKVGKRGRRDWFDDWERRPLRALLCCFYHHNQQTLVASSVRSFLKSKRNTYSAAANRYSRRAHGMTSSFSS